MQIIIVGCGNVGLTLTALPLIIVYFILAKYIVAVMQAKKTTIAPVGGKEYKFVLANIIYYQHICISLRRRPSWIENYGY